MDGNNFDFQPDLFSASQIRGRTEKQGMAHGGKARWPSRAALTLDRSCKRRESRIKPPGGYLTQKFFEKKILK